MQQEIPIGLDHIEYYGKVGFYALVVATTLHALFIPLFIWLDVFEMSTVNVFSVAIYLFCLYLYPSAVAIRDYSLIGWLVYVELIGHAIAACYYIGVESGFQYYVFMLATLPFFSFNYSLVTKTLRIIGLVAACIFLDIWLRGFTPQAIINEDYLLIMRSFNLIAFLIIASVISNVYAEQSAMYQKNLVVVATIDQLTGLYNRRHLIQAAEKEFLASNRTGNPVSLLMIDIDRFKKINDTSGHACGDIVLKAVAEILKAAVRPQNIVARWGGEEFIVLLPNTNSEDAGVVAERLRTHVEKGVISCENKELSVTITLGGATLREEESFNEILSRADDALYRGKERGRNRCVFG